MCYEENVACNKRERETMRSQTLTNSELLQQAHQILETKPFNREAEAKVSAILRMAELCRAGELDSFSLTKAKSLAQLWNRHQMEISERTVDAAALRFFAGRRESRSDVSKSISISGGRIDEWGKSYRLNGRALGAISELRDFSSLLERRTYTGLAEGSPTGGGDSVPIGFIAQVFQAMKMTDQLLGACDWTTAETAKGGPVDLPSVDDSSQSAVAVAEAASQTFQNPSAFGQVVFDNATMWTSKAILASIAMNEDAVPKLATTLADIFRVRFARGFGASVVSTVLADIPNGATTASPTAITQVDLLSLMAAVDAAYATAPGAGWAMSWTTLVYLLKNLKSSSTAGDAAFWAKTDGAGHYLLFEKPVYISPSMPAISAGNVPIIFGDLKRIIIRNVPTEAVIRRYDELFLASNTSVGYEMLIRADAAIVHAGRAPNSSSGGDDPIQGLRMSLS